MLGVLAQVLEWKNRYCRAAGESLHRFGNVDRRHCRARQRGLPPRILSASLRQVLTGKSNAEAVHRLGDVLHLLLAHVLIVIAELFPNGSAHCIGNTDSTGFSETLEPCRDVYTVAIDFVCVDNHITQIHPDSKLHLALIRYSRVAICEFLLDGRCATQCIDDSTEVSQDGVSRVMHYPSVVLLDARRDKIEVLAKRTMRAVFVLPA